jgi:hypothetical protein
MVMPRCPAQDFDHASSGISNFDSSAPTGVMP